MFERFRKRKPTVQPDPVAPVLSRFEGSRLVGRYKGLYEYLEHRYADTVCLTFGQIEDLLGFSLPDLARVDPEWWTATSNTTESKHAQSWIQAHMVATPNLFARNVVFERVS